MYKVSVVVPVYNVQEYLPACLDSIVSQTIDSLQVILVDDGSTDESGFIADRYVADHVNFQCHHIANQGLGHARNYGARYAEGEYICFLDSDDIVPSYAYQEMYELATKHRCDLVVGDVVRFDSTKEYPSALHNRAFAGATELMHISRQPSLFNDTTAWNKLFRKEFYDKNNFRWAEGMLYEDIPVTVPAHVLANCVAHLNQVVYKWRARDGGSLSITQRRKELDNFKDRLKAITMVDAFFDDNVADECLHIEKDYKWLDMDFKLYFSMLELVDDDYRKTFMEDVSAYLNRVNPAVFDRLRAIDRISYQYIREKNMQGLMSSLEYAHKGYKSIQIRKGMGAQFQGVFPFKGVSRDSANMTAELSNHDLNVKVNSIKSSGEDIVVKGEAFIPRLSIPRKGPSHEFELVDSNNCLIAKLDGCAERKQSAWKVRVSKKYRQFHLENQGRGGYRFTLSSNLLGKLSSGDYYVRMRYAQEGLSCDAVRIGHPSGDTALWQPALKVGDSKIVFFYNAQGELCIQKRKISRVVTSFHIDELGVLHIETICGKKELDLPFPSSSSDWRGCSDLESLDYFERDPVWFYVRSKSSAIRVASNLCGELEAREYRSAPVIRKACFSSREFLLQIDAGFCEAKILDVVLLGRCRRQSIHVGCGVVDKERGIYSCFVDLAGREALSALCEDTYRVSMLVKSSEDCDARWVDAICGVGEGSLGSHLLFDGYKHVISDDNGFFELLVKHVLPWYERTRFRRKLIEYGLYPLFRFLPMKKKTVVFESSWGRKTDCNPGALYSYFQQNHPEYRCIWSLRDTRIQVDGNSEKVRRGSLQYFKAMATAKYFVNNVNFSDDYVKRSGQIEIQTMHGTPLKTLGLDVPGELETPEARSRFLRRRARWDYLVVQSPAAKRITSSCYAFEKEFLETGYPRNDYLFERNNPDDINEIKERIGIPSNKKIILYAPTWRVRGVFKLMLDLERLQHILGDGYAIALRVHQFALPGVKNDDIPQGVINVSHVGHMEDLLLAADVLITDYSSVMFDFALLKKPMLFYAYDLEEYREKLRGFNIDFEAEAPGPILTSTNEVVDALLNMDRTIRESRQSADAFYEKYCLYEDGHASEKIYDIVFGGVPKKCKTSDTSCVDGNLTQRRSEKTSWDNSRAKTPDDVLPRWDS